ncbi:putative F-box/kelch-repeat protein At1g27420 [Coffea arabica]|uniref:F-box/kelch-repeat protein At1g27420 n=1 Tax=Coffea arabica TaxID=13443 RepID=A0ABM4WM39_COFAR
MNSISDAPGPPGMMHFPHLPPHWLLSYTLAGYKCTDVEVLSSVFCYNIHTEEWPNCAPLSVPRYDFAGTVCDNKIYVAGGHSALAGARGTAAAEVYDPLTDKWAPLPNTNRLRCKSVGVTWRGKVHVVGGFVQSYYIDGCSAEVYNVQSGKWDLVSGHLFGSGDCLSAWKGHIEFDDGKLTTWNVVEGSQLKRFPSPVSTYLKYGGEEDFQPIQGLYLTMAPTGSHLYFLAGYKVPGESSRTISMVHSVDTSATTATADHAWRSFEPIEEEGVRELCSHCPAVQLS